MACGKMQPVAFLEEVTASSQAEKLSDAIATTYVISLHKKAIFYIMTGLSQQAVQIVVRSAHTIYPY